MDPHVKGAAMELGRDFDPWEDTHVEQPEVRDDPFADLPVDSPIGPAGQIASIGVLARRLAGDRPARRAIAFVVALAVAVMLHLAYSAAL